jgi:phytoene dehydrogenase-like protein
VENLIKRWWISTRDSRRLWNLFQVVSEITLWAKISPKKAFCMCAVTRKKIAVIGAGPGGLTAAMILAHRGVEVDVYEIKPHVGGRNAFLQAGPYRFDVGPTFLMMKHILEEVFLEAGAECANYLTLQALDPMYRLQFDQFTLNCSTNLENMREQIRNLRPGKEKGFDTFIRRESRRFSFMEPCLQQPYLTVASLLSPRLLSALPHLSLSKTVYDVLLGYFQDPDLALAFCFQAKYLGMSAWQCPGAFTMLPLSNTNSAFIMSWADSAKSRRPWPKSPGSEAPNSILARPCSLCSSRTGLFAA